MTFLFNLKSRDSAKLSRPRRLARWSCLVALGSLSAHCLLAANGNTTGALTGSVVDDGGKPVAGARVLISHAPPLGTPPFTAPPVITGALAAMVLTDAIFGSFHTDGLAPGQYIACAEASAPGFLDPCHWATSAPSFIVSAGQTTTGVKIVMAKGPVLRIHIDDPLQLLKPVAGPVDLDFEIHVVTSKGFHYSAPVQSGRALARDHAITIPFDTPVTLRVMGAHLAVNDPSGRPISPLGTAVNVPEGTNPAVIGLRITGKKQ